MAETDEYLIYLKYKTITEMLRVISSFGQSTLGLTPTLYLNDQTLFVLSSLRDGIIVNYTTITQESAIKLKRCDWIELEESDDKLVNKGDNVEEQEASVLKKLIPKEKKQPKSGIHLLYIPLIKVEKTSLKFPP